MGYYCPYGVPFNALAVKPVESATFRKWRMKQEDPEVATPEKAWHLSRKHGRYYRYTLVDTGVEEDRLNDNRVEKILDNGKRTKDGKVEYQCLWREVEWEDEFMRAHRFQVEKHPLETARPILCLPMKAHAG
jgi:hypothetical protein